MITSWVRRIRGRLPGHRRRRGIIPPEDTAVLRERVVAAVFTPKDYQLTAMMDEIVTLVLAAHDAG